jgi:hypothetical protein
MGHQLAVERDNGHKIVKVVGNTGGQLANGRQPLLLLKLLLHHLSLGYVTQNNDPAAAVESTDRAEQ